MYALLPVLPREETLRTIGFKSQNERYSPICGLSPEKGGERGEGERERERGEKEREKEGEGERGRRRERERGGEGEREGERL